ncbi:MAG TPA: DUF1223 domain-containing protein [Kofleriaceae bacterium]|jgi:hypothetical protein
MRALSLSFGALAACASASADKPASGAPVVIELFTSQGCSSCPPADQLLAKLGRDGQSGGRAIVPLAFHVDYWNDLGWADPYATAAWTARQQEYARALGDRQVYTPELVVAGGAGMVGSQAGRVADAIAAAPVQSDVAATAAWSPGSLAVDATAPADAELWVAVWENATPTRVPSGENAGATLVAERVVRRLERVAAPGQHGHVAVALGTGWVPAGAVVFAQRADRHITAARVFAHPP